MIAASKTRRLLVACLAFVLISTLQVSRSPAQDVGIIGTWRTMVGAPSSYGQPGASIVFTTTFAPDGTYRTTAVIESGTGYWGLGGTYVMTGHYQMLPPSTLQYRLENSVLCVVVDSCKPSLAPGEQLGAVVSGSVQFEGRAAFVANGQRWTRVQ